MSSIIPSPLLPASGTRRGSMSSADKVKLDAITGTHTGTNTGDVTVSSPAGWLSVLAQVLTFALVSASQTVAGVVDLAAQTFAGVKTFASAIVASAGIGISNGALGTPSLSFTADPDTGFWSQGNGQMVCSANGARHFRTSGSNQLYLVDDARWLDTWTGHFANVYGARVGLGASTECAHCYGTPTDGAAAIGTKIGSATTLANATAKLASFINGVTEKAYVQQDGMLNVPGAAGVRWGSAAALVTHNGTGFTMNSRCTNSEYWQAGLYYQTGTGVALEAATCARLSSDAADGAAAVAAASEHSSAAWSNAAARLHSFRNGAGSAAEKSAVMANGEFEHFVAGAGIVLRSPDNTRYRLTVANGGTLVITAL